MSGSSFETGEGFSPQTLTDFVGTTPHPADDVRHLLPQGEKGKSAERYYSCPSSVSPPDTSTLPGAGSRFSFVTTPSSTSIE